MDNFNDTDPNEPLKKTSRGHPESSCASVCLEYEHEVNLVFNLVSTSESRYNTTNSGITFAVALLGYTNICINPTMIVQCTLGASSLAVKMSCIHRVYTLDEVQHLSSVKQGCG